MITYNLVTRIADDKEFLEPIFRCIGRIRKDIGRVRLNIIGGVHDEKVFNRWANRAVELDISDSVFFTKKSIRYDDMDKEILNGYFLTLSIGSFIGYSAIEAIGLGLKTIIVNINPELSDPTINEISFCDSIEDLYRLTRMISQNPEKIEIEILKENDQRKRSFFLNAEESNQLIGMF